MPGKREKKQIIEKTSLRSTGPTAGPPAHKLRWESGAKKAVGLGKR